MSGDALRVGVVGLGKMGLLHASLLNVMPNVELVGVCEKNSLTRKLAKKLLRSVRVVNDVTAFCDSDLDAVFITTPIGSHFSVAKTVFEKKLARHIFIEKPLTSSYIESKELSDLSVTNAGVNMVGYLRRFMVTFMKARELLVQGSIGQPASFIIDAYSSDFCGVQNNAEASIARGGVLRDLGSYAVDLALWFFGNIQLVSAETKSLTGDGAEDYGHFTVEQKSDRLWGEVSVSWCAEGYRMPEVNLSIIGSRGRMHVNDDSVSLIHNGGNRSEWFRHNLNDCVDFWLGSPEYYREDAYFIKSIISNSLVEPSFKTAAKVDLLIDTIKEKAERHG